MTWPRLAPVQRALAGCQELNTDPLSLLYKLGYPEHGKTEVLRPRRSEEPTRGKMKFRAEESKTKLLLKILESTVKTG